MIGQILQLATILDNVGMSVLLLLATRLRRWPTKIKVLTNVITTQTCKSHPRRAYPHGGRGVPTSRMV